MGTTSPVVSKILENPFLRELDSDAVTCIIREIILGRSAPLSNLSDYLSSKINYSLKDDQITEIAGSARKYFKENGCEDFLAEINKLTPDRRISPREANTTLESARRYFSARMEEKAKSKSHSPAPAAVSEHKSEESKRIKREDEVKEELTALQKKYTELEGHASSGTGSSRTLIGNALESDIVRLKTEQHKINQERTHESEATVIAEELEKATDPKQAEKLKAELKYAKSDRSATDRMRMKVEVANTTGDAKGKEAITEELKLNALICELGYTYAKEDDIKAEEQKIESGNFSDNLRKNYSDEFSKLREDRAVFKTQGQKMAQLVSDLQTGKNTASQEKDSQLTNFYWNRDKKNAMDKGPNYQDLAKMLLHDANHTFQTKEVQQVTVDEKMGTAAVQSQSLGKEHAIERYAKGYFGGDVKKAQHLYTLCENLCEKNTSSKEEQKELQSIISQMGAQSIDRFKESAQREQNAAQAAKSPGEIEKS